MVHGLHAKRLLFAIDRRDYKTEFVYAGSLKSHCGDRAEGRHVCMDMSAGYVKCVAQALAHAQVSDDRFHLMAMADEATEQVRRHKMAQDASGVRMAMCNADRKTHRCLCWGMLRNPSNWTAGQTVAMIWLQHSTLTSACAWRLRMALRQACAQARNDKDPVQAVQALKAWLSWARRCWLEPFKNLAFALGERFDGVVLGMDDRRSNAAVEAMNGLLQQAKRAVCGFRSSRNFIAVNYLCMSKVKRLSYSPFVLAMPR